MNRYVLGGSLVVLPLALSCGSASAPLAAGQLVVFLDTDALVTLGSASAVPGQADPQPLFDRVRIDGMHADGTVCDKCSRQFDVTEDAFTTARVSFGIEPPLAASDRVRARLYLTALALDGDPLAEATIDVTFALPPVPAEGVVERTVRLLTRDVGQPLGQDVPVATLPGRPSPSLVGTWPGARRVDCSGPARGGEVCIPGGAFWMGNPLVSHIGASDGDHLRLVVLSPFYMDVQEVTVGAFRAAGGRPAATWAGADGCDPTDYCTFTATPGAYDAYPVSCVYPDDARAYCQALGKDLPTEAEFEYVAGGLKSAPFVWGADDPQCADAVLGRGGLGALAGSVDTCLTMRPADGQCGGMPAGGLDRGGPLPAGFGARDRLTISVPSSTGTVLDLVGNVAEITRDSWSLLTDPCWSSPGIYDDPVCVAPTQAVVVRGGGWAGSGADGRAAVRNSLPTGKFSPETGFRCVRASP